MSEVAPEQPLMEQAAVADQTGQSLDEVQAPAEEWTAPTREEWEAQQALLQQVAPFAEYMQAAVEQQGQQQPGQADEWDPFAPNALEQVRNLVREEMAPYAQYTQAQQSAEMDERAADILNDYLTSKGSAFLGDEEQQAYAQEQALIRANHYVAEEAERYGPGLKAAETAIQRAVDEQLAHDQAVGQAYAAQQINQVRQITQAPQQPQQSGAPAAQTLTTQGGPQAVLQKYYGGGNR